MGTLVFDCLSMGPSPTNCYIIYREGNSKAVVVDPPWMGERIYQRLEELGIKVKVILLTHAHYDHIMGVNELLELSGAELFALDEERLICGDPELNVSGKLHRPYTVSPTRYLMDGELLSVGDISCKVIATPGHTRGSCCFYFEEAGVLISGDTLAYESFGRTNLPTGDRDSLVHSIKEKLFLLPDNTIVYPGHEDSTTIGHEKTYNPILRQ